MRRLFTQGKILILSLLFGAVLFQSVSAKEAAFSFRCKNGETVLSTAFNSDELRYSLKLNLGKNGEAELKNPPFFNITTKDGIVLGEMKLSSYANFALNPLNTSVYNLYMQKGVYENSKDTQKPAFSGIAKNFKFKKSGRNLTVAAFSPVFNAASPLGFLASYSNPNLFAAVVHLSSNNFTRKSLSVSYQKDWRSVKLYTERTYFLFGCRSDFKIGEGRLKTFVFSDTVLDGALGLWGVSGWNVNFTLNPYVIDCYKRFNSSGEMNKPVCEEGFTLSVKRGVNLALSYRNELYPMPIYGGASRENEVSFCVNASYGLLSFVAKHTYHIEKTTGHREESEYSLSFGRCKILDNYVDCRLAVELGRADSVDLFVKKFSLKLQDRLAEIEISGEKLLMSLSYEAQVERVKVDVSVSQDKALTLGAKYEY